MFCCVRCWVWLVFLLSATRVATDGCGCSGNQPTAFEIHAVMTKHHAAQTISEFVEMLQQLDVSGLSVVDLVFHVDSTNTDATEVVSNLWWTAGKKVLLYFDSPADASNVVPANIIPNVPLYPAGTCNCRYLLFVSAGDSIAPAALSFAVQPTTALLQPQQEESTLTWNERSVFAIALGDATESDQPDPKLLHSETQLRSLLPKAGFVVSHNSWIKFKKFDEQRSSRGFTAHRKLTDRALCIPGLDCGFESASLRRLLTEFAFGRGQVALYMDVSHILGVEEGARLYYPGHASGPHRFLVRGHHMVGMQHFVWQPLHTLRVFNMTSEPTTLPQLRFQSFEFLQSVRIRGGWKDRLRYEPLLATWGHYGTCVLDLLDADSSQQPKPGNNKGLYLMFEPRGHLFEQLVSFAIAVSWAQLLGRKLVIPDLLWYRKKGEPELVRYGSVFDLSSNSWSHFPISLITAEKLPLQAKPTRIVHTEFDVPFKRSQTATAFFRSIGVDDVPSVAIPRFPIANMLNSDVQNMFGECADVTLAFDNLITHRPLMDLKAFLDVVSLPVLALRQFAGKAMKTHQRSPGSGVCVHIDANLQQECKAVAHRCESWAVSLARNGFACGLSLDTQLEQLKQRREDGVLVMLEPNERRIALSNASSALITTADMKMAVSVTPNSMEAFVIHSIMCASAGQLEVSKFHPTTGLLVQFRDSFKLHTEEYLQYSEASHEPLLKCRQPGAQAEIPNQATILFHNKFGRYPADYNPLKDFVSNDKALLQSLVVGNAEEFLKSNNNPNNIVLSQKAMRWSEQFAGTSFTKSNTHVEEFGAILLMFFIVLMAIAYKLEHDAAEEEKAL